MPARAQVRTSLPDGSRRRYLGAMGPVSGLAYSFTVPGGCDQLRCALGIPPVRRTDAMDPGRLVEVVLGGSVVWAGTLNEPEPADGGWTITARGSGTWGSQYCCDYSGTWAASVPDGAVNNAIGRGLGWLPSNVGHPAGIYLGQPSDPGSVMIDDMLNAVTSQGGLTWQVARTANGDELQVFPLPGAADVNRLLVCTSPAGRTLGGDWNAIQLRFMKSPDLGDGYPALFGTVWATDDASIARHGRMEVFQDLSDVGLLAAADAQAVGDAVLRRYQRAAFSGPFAVSPGQLLTTGGQPADLGVFYSAGDPMMCRLILTDQGWGGEVTEQEVTFLVGEYEYSDDTGTAVITPFNTFRQDFAALLAARAGRVRPRKFASQRWGPNEKLWWFTSGDRTVHERRRRRRR